MFKTFYEDRDFLENKYHRTDMPFDPHSRRSYHGYDYPDNGFSDEEINEGLRNLDKEIGDLPHPVAKALAIKYVLENTKIDVNEHDYFAGINTWNRNIDIITFIKWKEEVFSGVLSDIDSTMKDLNASGAVTIWPDFDHVVPDWDALMELGFSGIRERARNYRKMHEQNRTLADDEKAFFDGIEIEYSAIIDFVDRLYHFASLESHEKAQIQTECLIQLRDGAPTNIYEAMQFIYIYFMISESIDHYQVRSLGSGLDSTLYPFYLNDLESGRFTHEEIKEFIAYFLMQWSAIGNYWGQPFYLGGTEADGSSKVNELSRDILDVYDKIGIYDPKIQIKYNSNVPADFLGQALEMIRGGHNSIVFCCEPGMWNCIMSYGATFEEARNMNITGCYEMAVKANEVVTATGYINPLKAVVYALNDGFDDTCGKQIGLHTGDASKFRTFEDVYAAFIAQSEHLINETIRCANTYDPYLAYINPSSMYSATIETSLKNAHDGYGGGVKYNNSEILVCGVGTAVDALMALYELVFEKKEATMDEMLTALKNNWVGYEKLRIKALHSKHKYGNSDPLTDTYASAILRFYSDKINGRPNGRGGIYKTELHSALQYVLQGKKTGATPDGRKAGDEISKNASPTPGMDKNGVTALIKSALALNPSAASCGFCVDIMLHPSTVSGDDGLGILKSLIDLYMKNGGLSIQFNIFNSEILHDAQNNPEKYKNLQVRVCGWNVLWNNLSRDEQDAFILRAENIV